MLSVPVMDAEKTEQVDEAMSELTGVEAWRKDVRRGRFVTSKGTPTRRPLLVEARDETGGI